MLFTLNDRHDVHYLFDGCYSPQEYKYSTFGSYFKPHSLRDMFKRYRVFILMKEGECQGI